METRSRHYGDVIKWIQYEEFDKNWKVIEHYRDDLQAFEILNGKLCQTK
jgi:hypothetical protein